MEPQHYTCKGGWGTASTLVRTEGEKELKLVPLGLLKVVILPLQSNHPLTRYYNTVS